LAFIARLKGARTVIVHSLADTEQCAFDTSGWPGFWRKALFSSFDSLVAVSPALYQGLSAHFPERVVLLPYGIRDDVFIRSERARQSLRSENGIQEDDVIFVFTGTVCRRKGFDLLAQAFAQLADQHPYWHLWVVGPHSRTESQNVDESEVDSITAPLKGLERRVRFWGRVDERAGLSRIFSACDVFVFPSRREGMGIAPLEAMAVGLPVVIARIPGITDLANVEGETGSYFPPGDFLALETAMLRLGTDEELRRRMGEQAAQVVRKGFGWAQYISMWLRLYEDKPVREDGSRASEASSFAPRNG
jgi:glycosyltransferase involved in cell wall biosynthesis